METDEIARLESMLSSIGTSKERLEKLLESITLETGPGVSYKVLPSGGLEIFIYLISDKVKQAKAARDHADVLLRKNLPRKAYRSLMLVYASPE